jgi:predicted nucleic acid-binding protein
MIVISNASPLVALSRIYRLDLFQQLFGTLLIPPSVNTEVVTYCPNARQKRHLEAALDTFIITREPQHHQIFSRQIGEGERGVLNLALDLTPNIVLLDDRKARNEARELGLFPTFTSDVLKEAEAQGLIPSYRELFQTLYAQHIYLPES